MQPQPGAIAQAAQPAPRMNPRTSAALMEMVRGQGRPDDMGGLMELIKSLGGSQPQHTPNQMLQQMRAPR